MYKVYSVNLPQEVIKAIEKLVGEDSIYASRSELIREAVRGFLNREINKLENTNKTEKLKIIEPPNYITGFGLVKKVKVNPNSIQTIQSFF